MNYFYEEPANFNFENYVAYQAHAAEQVKMEPGYLYPRTRPGPLPAIRDEDVDHIELERRTRRRERNRHAASRCRMRRTQRVGYLEGQVQELHESKMTLLQANEALKAELERVKVQVNLEQANVAKTEPQSIPTQELTVSFTPLLRNLKFEFPSLSDSDIQQARKESTTEFNKLLHVL